MLPWGVNHRSTPARTGSPLFQSHLRHPWSVAKTRRRILQFASFHRGQVAGHDTTSFMMASAIYYLAATPEAKEKLVAEVDAFGRAPPCHEDLERFPYVEVRRMRGYPRLARRPARAP